MDLITKRLHISGLTPNISSKDLEGRFASFGTVKALDGLGQLDGNGDPRRFAYVTLEGSKAQVSKCLNVLSGATWKGAKLRVGEARPDYRERIAKENDVDAEEDSERPKKRRRLLRGTQGVHASNMSLVTAENCATRSGGWIKTPMGRLVRPMRMRPVHPLPAPQPSTSTTAATAKSSLKERKKKGKEVTRARRKLINPLLYGSEYLKGVLLEGEARILPDVKRGGKSEETELVQVENDERAKGVEEPVGDEGDELELDNSEEEENSAPDHEPPLLVTPIVAIPSSSAAPKAIPPPTNQPTDDFAEEAKHDLLLLNSLFGGDEDDWGGQETLSDVDVTESRVVAVPGSGAADDDFEVVPREKVELLAGSRVRETKKPFGGAESMGMDVDGDSEEDAAKSGTEETKAADDAAPSTSTSKPSASAVQATRLKDMFLPREEDAGFSLFANLDLELDLELDDDVPQAAPLITHHHSEPPRYEPSSQHPSSSQPAISSTSHLHSTSALPSFDPNRTLFFPLPSPSSSAAAAANSNKSKTKIKQKDLYAVLSERDWLGAPPFVRTGTEEEIRKYWEEKKGDLTAEWKARWRGARKRGGGALGAGGGL